MLYVIISVGVVAFITLFTVVIRQGAKDSVNADVAEAKVEEITNTIKAANEIDTQIRATGDADLDKRLSEFTD